MPALVSPVPGSASEYAQNFILDHQVRCFVLDDGAMTANGHRVGFTHSGAVLLSDPVAEENKEAVARHELTHTMRHLEFDPYTRFLMGKEHAADLMRDIFTDANVLERFAQADRTAAKKLRGALVKFRDRIIGEIAGVGDALVQGAEVRAEVDELLKKLDR